MASSSSLRAKRVGRETMRSMVEGLTAPFAPSPHFVRSPSPSLHDGED
jgi:hypothetical protein